MLDSRAKHSLAEVVLLLKFAFIFLQVLLNIVLIAQPQQATLTLTRFELK